MCGIACLHAHTHAYAYKYKLDTHTEKISLLQICNRSTKYYLKQCRKFVWKIQHEGACQEICKYSKRQSRVLYLSRDTSLSAVFFVHTSTGSALDGILSCY